MELPHLKAPITVEVLPLDLINSASGEPQNTLSYVLLFDSVVMLYRNPTIALSRYVTHSRRSF